MLVLREAKPARDVLFVASSGHELGHLGINAFVDRRSAIVLRSIGWIHLGANIGAASGASSPQSAVNSPSADGMDEVTSAPVAAAAHRVTEPPCGRFRMASYRSILA